MKDKHKESDEIEKRKWRIGGRKWRR